MKKHKADIFFFVLSFVFLLCFIIAIAIDTTLDSQNKYSSLLKCLEIVFSVFSFTSSGFSFCFSININTGIINSTNSGNTTALIVYGNNGISELAKKVVEPVCETNNENSGNTDNKNLIKQDNDSPKEDLSVNSMASYKKTQRIWANLIGRKRLFIGRKTKRGFISKRAYDILKNKTTLDIELLSETFKAAFSSGEICLDFCKGLSEEELLKLCDWGLIKTGLVNESVSIEPEKEAVIMCGQLVFIIKNKSHDDSQNINWDCYMLTREGMELQKALDETISFKSALNFCKDIVERNQSNQNLKFSAFDLLKLDEDPKTGIEYPIYGKIDYLSQPNVN